MTTHFESSPIGRRIQAPLLIATVARYVRMISAALLSWNNRRILARTVATMDDRMLADIGLTRSDVHSALSEPLWHDPSLRLRSLAEDRRNAEMQQRRNRLQRRHPGGGAPLKRATPSPARAARWPAAQPCCDAAA